MKRKLPIIQDTFDILSQALMGPGYTDGRKYFLQSLQELDVNLTTIAASNNVKYRHLQETLSC